MALKGQSEKRNKRRNSWGVKGMKANHALSCLPKFKKPPVRGRIWQMSIPSWLSVPAYPCDFSDKRPLDCNVYIPQADLFLSLASWIQISTHFQALSSLIKHQAFPGALGNVLLLHLLPINPTWFLPTAGWCADLYVEYQWHGHRTKGTNGCADTEQTVGIGERSFLDFSCGIKESWQVKGSS